MTMDYSALHLEVFHVTLFITKLCEMNLLEVSGCVFLSIVGVQTLGWLASLIIRNLRRNGLDRCQPGDYAVVTGATDGIGYEYARQLAQKGFNLLLLSRTEEKLIRTADVIRKEFSQCGEVKTLAVDFSNQDIYPSIAAKVNEIGPNISVLVNNVGTAYPIPEYFHNYPEDFNRKLINTNITSTTIMTEIVLKPMLKLGRGIIINISSYAGVTEIPMFSTYSASKAYMNSFGSALWKELEPYNILVQTVTPNQVDTKLASKMLERSVAMSAEDFVRHALSTVGRERQTSGHPKHKIINSLSGVFESIVGYNLSMIFKLKVVQDARRKIDATDA